MQESANVKALVPSTVISSRSNVVLGPVVKENPFRNGPKNSPFAGNPSKRTILWSVSKRIFFYNRPQDDNSVEEQQEGREKEEGDEWALFRPSLGSANTALSGVVEADNALIDTRVLPPVEVTWNGVIEYTWTYERREKA